MCASVVRCRQGKFTQPTHTCRGWFTTTGQNSSMPAWIRRHVDEGRITQRAGAADAG